MQRSLLFSFIAADKPGIIDTLSNIVAKHDGNWLTSRLTQLSGRFAGIVQISISEKDVDALTAELKALSARQISVLVDQPGDIKTHKTDATDMQLSVIGLDRPGIVREIAQALAAQMINVGEMNSVIESAPMTGEPLFKADLAIEVPASLDLDGLREQLDTISDKLDIDWQLADAG